tara:strand:+ start:299 stop:757 length:459 start_codon:yes stop_codon:yes gene_type:complete
MKNKKYWLFNKVVLPQHTDHAGVMWHGTYLNWLEESRIDALAKAGISYAELIEKGFEMPVIDININYKSPILIGNNISIISSFHITKKPKILISSSFLDKNNIVHTTASINVILVKKDNFTIVRNRPEFIINIFDKLNNGSVKSKAQIHDSS